MVTIRTDRQLINQRKLVLDKIEKQSRIWLIFSGVSALAIIAMIMAIIVVKNIFIIYLLLASIFLTSISWWIWTMIFIIETTKNQKIIYKLLHDISFDIESIRSVIRSN
jgi:hypothetical protein